MRTHRMDLDDGRTLTWAELGSHSDGAPVVVHQHGSSSSRLEMGVYDNQFAEYGIRVIAVDRPGYGGSSPTLDPPVVAAIANDTAALLGHLQIAGCVASGYSTGSAFALAMAALETSSRMIRAVLLRAPVAPGLAPRDAHEAERRKQAQLVTWPAFAQHYEQGDASDTFAPADQDAFTDPDFAAGAMATLAEGSVQGTTGIASDHYALATPWGFDLGRVRQPVTIWHGEDDRAVPTTHAQALADILGSASLHLVPHEGHYSIGRQAFDHVLDVLA